MSGDTEFCPRPSSPSKDEEVKCSVCLEIFGPEEKIELVCRHTFHSSCAKTWYRTNNPCYCPLCRTRFNIVKYITNGVEHPETDEWRTLREEASEDDPHARMSLDIQLFFLQLFADALRANTLDGFSIFGQTPRPRARRAPRARRGAAAAAAAAATATAGAATGAGPAEDAATAPATAVAAPAAAASTRAPKRRRTAHRESQADDDDDDDWDLRSDQEDSDYRPSLAARAAGNSGETSAPRRGRSRGRLD